MAVVQLAPTLGDLTRNMQLHLDGIAAAKRQGADAIVFPELSLTGYFLRDMTPDVALRPDAAPLQELIAAAAPAGLIVGFVEESPQHRFYNAALYAEAGRIVHVHRKVYLPTYGLFEERRYFAAGDRLRAFDTQRLGRVGLLVCEDFWHVSAATVMQAEEVDVLVCVSNSPARGLTGPEIRTAETYDRLTRMYAEMLGVFVVFANRVGFEDGLCFWGGSRVVGPDAGVLAQAPQFDEAVLLAQLDRHQLRRQRMLTPLATDEQLLLTLNELERIRRRRFDG